ncbi:hypothetical protein Tco_1440329 [Tanacetum coccineum]
MSSECNNITLAIRNDKSKIFAMCGKLTASSNIENQSEKSVCDNASTSNPSKPSSKGFSNSASLLGRLTSWNGDALHTFLPPTIESLKRYLFHFSWRSTRCYRLSHSKVVDIEKAVVRSSLRLPNNKCALIKSIAIEINLYLIRGHIHNRTLVVHHPVHKLYQESFAIILVIIAETSE